jgi:hypothetical protein
VINTLSPDSGRHRSKDVEAESSYLLGKSYFQLADARILRFRGNGRVGMGALPGEVVEWLEKSNQYFETAGDISPDGPYAAESFYLAGSTQDFGYLQDFQKAQELYRWTMKAYPDSRYGMLARERFEEINKIILNTKDSSHGK